MFTRPEPTTTVDKPKPRKRATKDSRMPPLDWAATHGPITGAVSATTGAAAVALLGTATGMPGTLPLLVGAAGAIGHGIGHSVFRRLTARTGVTRAASWLLAGGWTTWAIAEGPLTWAAAGTLTGIGVGIGAMASNAAMHEEVAEEERLTAEARAAVAAMDHKRRIVATEWTARLKRITGLDVVVTAVEFWKNGAGYSIGGDLPGGAVWTQLRDKARHLASDARLPHGCLVEIEEGAIQGTFAIDINTINIMRQLTLFPEDYSPLSILTGIPWGLRPNSDPVLVFLREACALILGPPGSGKSTFVDGILAGFARCVDVLVWVIDLKGGAVGMPWVRPYLEAQGLIDPVPGQDRAPEDTRPGVDWIASTPAEALLMLTVALVINTARQQGYQELMVRKNTTLLPVSANLPQIELVVDEGAELLSAPNNEPFARELKKLILRFIRLTRAMGERAVLTALDGNLSAIGNTEVRKYSPVGTALTSGENSTSNVGKLFSRAKIDTSQLSEKGAGVIGQAGQDGFKPTAFKTWKTSPNMVRDAILATNSRRPSLDRISAEAAGRIYTERWSPERAGWMWGAPEYREPDVTAYLSDIDDEPQPIRTQPKTSRPAATGGGLPLSYKRQQPADDPDVLADRLMKQIDDQYGTTEEPAAQGLNLSYKRTAPEDRIDPRLSFARNLIRAAGTEGLDTRDLWPALNQQFGANGWDRTVVTNWLSKDVTAGTLHRKTKGVYGYGPQPTETTKQADDNTDQVNALLGEAIELVVAKQHASTAFLQRNLRIGWDLANAVMAALAADGIIGPNPDENGTHPVLRKPED
ncbi:DNA translocase FtsK [Streptomyces sp. NPDC056192]|uniref:DNA translocase FtsK n=1 Tax=Streptomyces sp. NPDC056192 TaxID=3345743 RepID=UPI0035E3820B